MVIVDVAFYVTNRGTPIDRKKIISILASSNAYIVTLDESLCRVRFLDIDHSNVDFEISSSIRFLIQSPLRFLHSG